MLHNPSASSHFIGLQPEGVSAWRQVYYDLRNERKEQSKEKEIAIVRVEQLAPFPFDLINRELKRYPNADVMW